MKQKLLLTQTIILLISFNLWSQSQPGSSLPHYFTPEELLRKHEIGRDFIPTDPPEHPVRMVAEFEQMQSVLIRYPFGIPMTLIQEMAEDCKVMTIVANSSQQQQVLAQYQSAGVNTDNCEWLIAPTDSYWTRDYGPWFVVDAGNNVGICDFPYNRPRHNDDNIPVVLAQQLDIPLYGMDLIHTGGNWMCDGLGRAASSELVWEENDTLSHEEIDTLVSDYLGIAKYHVLPDPLGEYIEHIDCWGKFLDVDKVLVGQVPVNDPRYNDYEYIANYFAFQTTGWGNTYQVYRVYTPGKPPGTTYSTPYTNSLILNKKVFVPITGSQWDDEALAVYEEAMPGYEIIGVFHNNWEDTDALHCRAKGIADLGMLYVKHMPVLGQKNFRLQWDLTADIIPYSGALLMNDSLLCYYKVDSGNFQAIPLTHVTGRTYKTTIPFVEPGSQVSYYLQAKDYTGRKKYHPYIGAPDPHTFTVKYATDAMITPDTLTFLTVEEMIEGKSFDIYNFTSDELEISYIEHEGLNNIPWYIDPWTLTLPHMMSYGDTLTMNVKINMPVAYLAGQLIEDTLDISTEYSLKHVIIRVDEDLLSSIKDRYKARFAAGIFPNPLSGTSRITFGLSAVSMVTVEVLDMEGKKVQAITERNFTEGTHQVIWDSERLPAGIYFVRVITGEGTATEKAVVIR